MSVSPAAQFYVETKRMRMLSKSARSSSGAVICNQCNVKIEVVVRLETKIGKPSCAQDKARYGCGVTVLNLVTQDVFSGMFC